MRGPVLVSARRMKTRRVQIARPGGYDRLKVVEFDLAPPAPHEVQLETTSIGVNFADVVVRLGLYPSAKKYVGWPITPGFEFAGRVTRVGAEVTRFGVGDLVFGVTRFGAYAAHLNVAADYCFPLPSGLDPRRGGGFAVANLTAYYALFELGAARPGQTVLVHSAAGAVGSALVQLAKARGLRVLGVVGSGAKVEAVRSLGADVVLDKSSSNLWARVAEEAPDGLALALDANGYETLRGSYRALRPTGRLVVYGAHSMLSRGSGRANWLKLAWTFLRTPRFDPLSLTNDNKSVLGFNLSYLFDERDMLHRVVPDLVEHFLSGSLRMPAVTEFSLEDVAAAHEALQSGATIGKLLLLP